MKLIAAPIFLLAAFATTVLAQAAGSDYVDDLLSRDDLEGSITAREVAEIHARHADEIFEAKRDLERLERRSRSVCYAGCNQFTGQNKINCWKKCDKIWGN
ncbi:hypothetical protein CPC08DRAFT_712278 [Agrocybe pediades]|nr:hypothetical protein CPC08DRAFT_712278 [Agrocybe pediades]